MEFRRAARVGLVALVLLAACTSESNAPEARRPNVVVVVIDTLRKDHVSAYGYERETTPFIDSLAHRGLRCENPVAQAPWTGASMASIWTSLYPSETGLQISPVKGTRDPHGIRDIGRHPITHLHGDTTTLAEVLSRGGYDTIAVCTNTFASNSYSLLRGFADQQFPGHVSAEVVVDIALSRLAMRESENPFFLYVHFMDLHQPTTPPPKWASAFPTLDGKPHERAHAGWAYSDGTDLDSEAFRAWRSHKIALYDGALRYVDHELARLQAALAKDGTAAGTVWVVASDHGEEFWEHAQFEREYCLRFGETVGVGHGHTLFKEQLQVPLILSGPGVPQATIDRQTLNLDIMPTVIGLADATTLRPPMRGLDLIAAHAAGGIPRRVAFSESIAYGTEAKSIQDEQFQLVVWAKTKRPQRRFLFDTTRDPPHDAIDRREDQPIVAAQLEDKLRETLGGMTPRVSKRAQITAEALETLRSLGYVK
jgi:arylsulfatase A-like enzyme